MILIALIAALAMVVQDILGTAMVMSESRNKANLAATLDALQWGVAIAVTAISVTALQSHSLYYKILVVTLVTLANYGGTYAGVRIGERYIKPIKVLCQGNCCEGKHEIESHRILPDGLR